MFVHGNWGTSNRMHKSSTPLPEFARIHSTARVRAEWDTRDTANTRLFSTMYPNAVTSAGLAKHPTHGAEPFMPTASRIDVKLYKKPYFPDNPNPDACGKSERSRLPKISSSIRDVQRSIVEDNRFRNTDTDARIIERVFNQRLP